MIIANPCMVPGTVLRDLHAQPHSVLTTTLCEEGAIVTPTWQLKKPKWREIKPLAQDDTASKRRSWDLNSGSVAWEPALIAASQAELAPNLEPIPASFALMTKRTPEMYPQTQCWCSYWGVCLWLSSSIAHKPIRWQFGNASCRSSPFCCFQDPYWMNCSLALWDIEVLALPF